MKIIYADYEFYTEDLEPTSDIAMNPDLAKAHFEKNNNGFCGDHECDYCKEASEIITRIINGEVEEA
jgi:hypothetical protein